MAKQTGVQITDRGQVKRGDTWGVLYEFEPMYTGFSWTGITIDCILTSVSAPNDNNGSAAIRLGQTLTVNPITNWASYIFQLSPTESKALIPGTSYKDECQLKQGTTNVVTPVTGSTLIAQDYVI